MNNIDLVVPYYDIGFIEDDYEEPKILLNMVLQDCSESKVEEIWVVKYIQSTTKHVQFVILLDDSTHYCTYLYLIHSGFVCRHFFSVMIHSKNALFDIRLINSHWYSKEGFMLIDERQEFPIKIIKDNEVISISVKTFEMLEKFHGEEVYNKSAKQLNSKREFYGHSFGLYKKALNLAITNASLFQKLLENISNPARHKGKGRPTNKRYLSSIENHFKKYANSSSQDENMERLKKKNKQQCGICKSLYHDSRNCPLKNNKEGDACFDQENLMVESNI
ncbi:hypothetical protein RhiirA4_483646 [Rhizophagus irregularis]|uniref:Uncharacterized protein n=1 Tax=Rhizophagus irregularis TaxID=588596 RepID=A0A2I1HMU4_9GLOM|nr:hypothetical protein RhiirA4_483646 [Rhizophagus irregularis]